MGGHGHYVGHSLTPCVSRRWDLRISEWQRQMDRDSMIQVSADEPEVRWLWLQGQAKSPLGLAVCKAKARLVPMQLATNNNRSARHNYQVATA
jgi:hypothetical protein